MSVGEGQGAELVWRVQELRAARESGLMGALVGCLPRAPRQNTRLGRPLLLRGEESALLRGEESALLRGEESALLRVEGSALLKGEESALLRGEESVLLRGEESAHLRGEESALLRVEGSALLKGEESALLKGEESALLKGEESALLKGEESALLRGEGSALMRGEGSALMRGEGSALMRGEGPAPEGEESAPEGEGSPGQRWEEFLDQSLEQQRQLALDDRKSALMSSLSGPALASALAALDSFVFPRSALAVQLSTCREGLPLRPIRSQCRGSEPIGEQLQCQGRVQVFRDLRRRGFYLTSGGKFGVDFLVYPGDALRFHAHFMALCVSLEDSLSLEDVLSWIRLSSNVKKTLLLCSASPPGGVCYSSLQWSNMS